MSLGVLGAANQRGFLSVLEAGCGDEDLRCCSSTWVHQCISLTRGEKLLLSILLRDEACDEAGSPRRAPKFKFSAQT